MYPLVNISSMGAICLAQEGKFQHYRVHFLDERLARLTPDQIDTALKQNIGLKIELEERDRELRELRRCAADDSADALLADRSAELEDELDNMRGLLEDNMDELERLRDIVEHRYSDADGGRVTSLEAVNAELLARAEEQADLADQREEEKEDSRISSSNCGSRTRSSHSIYVLGYEDDRLKEDSDRMCEDEAAECERLEALASVLKDCRQKIVSLRVELEHVTQMYEARSGEIHAHRDRQEELASHVEDLVAQLHAARARERRTLDTKELALQSALADLVRTQALLGTRDADLAAVLQTLEGGSQKADETYSSAHSSVELEVDRVTRDLERVEAELTWARAELAERNSRGRGRDEVIDAMHAEILELKGGGRTDADKILGVDKTPKKAGQAETKPFINFSVFHDNLITRLEALSQIQTDLVRRAKDVEAHFVDHLNEMRKQLDMRWKQIDKFEAGVKGYADAKAGWRRKFSAKEGELEALKAVKQTTNAEPDSELAMKTGHAPVCRELLELKLSPDSMLGNAQICLSFKMYRKTSERGINDIIKRLRWFSWQRLHSDQSLPVFHLDPSNHSELENLKNTVEDMEIGFMYGEFKTIQDQITESPRFPLLPGRVVLRLLHAALLPSRLCLPQNHFLHVFVITEGQAARDHPQRRQAVGKPLAVAGVPIVGHPLAFTSVLAYVSPDVFASSLIPHPYVDTPCSCCR
ncbi:hypothetical protein B0H11DRAFT_2415061 [Mycena galericulata]|nr:hypothetical protein B0H11DRAFT_2415061 [Mycena galericulata]